MPNSEPEPQFVLVVIDQKNPENNLDEKFARIFTALLRIAEIYGREIVEDNFAQLAEGERVYLNDHVSMRIIRSFQ